MGRYTDRERNQMISMCQSLGRDTSFDLTSDCTPLYNCIGFAMGMRDVCVALGNPAGIAWSWWPPTAHFDMNPSSLVEAFEYFGFSTCNDGTIEVDYDKVALYSKNGEWTHAAIVETENLYHSKMGIWWDIVHRSGDLFHDEDYGDIFTFMKRHKSERHLSINKKPQTGTMKALGHVYAVMQHDGKRYGFVRVG